MNKVFLTGNLTADPVAGQVREKTICKFQIAVNRKFGNTTDYFRVTAWDNIAANCLKFLAKGSKVTVVGELQNNTSEKDGIRRIFTEVRVEEVEFLSFKTQDGSNESNRQDLIDPLDVDGDMPF